MMYAVAGLEELVFIADLVSIRVKKEMEERKDSPTPFYLVRYEIEFPNHAKANAVVRYDWGKLHFVDSFIDELTPRLGCAKEFQDYIFSDSKWKNKWEEYGEKINDWFTCALQHDAVKISNGKKVYTIPAWRKFLVSKQMKRM